MFSFFFPLSTYLVQITKSQVRKKQQQQQQKKKTHNKKKLE